MTAERCTHMAGATPFLEQLAGRRRAGRHAPARPEGVHLRRRLGVAVADPQGHRLFRAGRGHAGCTGRRRCRSPRSARCGDPEHAADTDGRAGHRRHQTGRRRRDPRPRTQMLVGYLHPEDETGSLRRRGLLPHRRSRPLGRRRLPGGHRPGQGHHHPQRREHLAQGDRGHPRRPSRHRRDRGRRPSRRAHRRAGLRGHRAAAISPRRTSTDLRELLDAQGVAKFKVPEQVEIWDALPKNDAGKVLKHRIRAATADEKWME